MSLSFNTPLSGLMAAQKAIRVTQSNLSNMNTVGYVREKIELAESLAVGTGMDSKVGSGVLVENIRRMTDVALQDTYNSQSATVGYYEELERVLGELETVMGDSSTGSLGTIAGNYFKAWEELSKFPEENSYRSALAGETLKLTQKLNEMGTELVQVKQNVINNTKANISEMNNIMKKLAEVNNKINESGNIVPNSLLNERDKFINELSSYAKIEVSYENQNPEVVSVRLNGTYLVDRKDTYDIQLLETDDGFYLSNGTTHIDNPGGKLKANLELLNNNIKNYTDKVNEFSEELILQVNSLHVAGYSLNGDTGINFFVGTDSRDIKLNPVLSSDLSKIATSPVLNVVGNTDVAKNISKVLTQQVGVDSGMNFSEYANSFSLTMAQDLNHVNNQLNIQKEVLVGIGERKTSIEGVNLEEEMTNLMMFQKYFSANAKSISTLQDIFDTLLEI